MSEIRVPGESLVELANANGVATEYWDADGNHRVVSADTIVAVLGGLGIGAETQQQITQALIDTELGPWRHTLPACVVARQGRDSDIHVHVPHGFAVRAHVEFEAGGDVDLEQIDVWVEPRDVDGTLMGRATFKLPAGLPLGWHQVVAVTQESTATSPLAVVPDRMPAPNLATGRGWGVMEQLYSVRSKQSWGIGDARDMAETAAFFGDLGADFLLINPAHAAAPVPPMVPSPYLPVTRRFVNPIYIRPEDILEVGYLPGPQRALVEWAVESVRERNTSKDLIDRDAAWDAKSQALEVIFQAPRSRARQRQFERFREREGRGLEDFATWCALTEKFGGKKLPPELSNSASPFVARQRRELEERINYHAWLQWIVDQQLQAAQDAALDAGMGIGIMHDLAVGVHPEGSDTWSDPDAFARTIEVGAPPDMYNQQGQNWSQPPWRPNALAETAYEPLRAMCRTVLRHTGALRVDHILGFFRLWWIPKGKTADHGTYVRYDHEAMLGVLMLEAYRAGAILIGEDLGTVEDWVHEYLDSRGILGTSVFWFDKDEDGRPRPPENYRELVLATVVTHDMPPTAGYMAGEHIDLRESLGLLTRSAEELRAEFRVELDRTLGSLTAMGLIAPEATEREIVEALHRYLAKSPSLLVGVALVDAVGERRSQNQPGTDTEYPNWQVPLADGAQQPVLVEDFQSNARLLSLVAALRDELGPADRLA